MIVGIINEYRITNGKCPANWNKVLSDYCQAHTLAMASREDAFHAPSCYLNDYREAIGVVSFGHNFPDTIWRMIDEFNSSPEHRSILQDCQELGYGVLVHKGMLYMTVRGR
jgi:uncharacterized protein YkwD